MRQTDKLWYGTNSGQQPFSLMWNLQGRDSWGITSGMYRVGDRWQQGRRYPDYQDMWFNVVAGDMIRPWGYGGARASHWNLGNQKPFKETTLVGGFDLDPGEATNGNFLTDDGAVSNHNNMQRDQPNAAGPQSFMVPGDYATKGPRG
jgi:hypothetical protein